MTAGPAGQQPDRGRSAALDGLRGYASLSVLFFHAILGANPELVPSVLYRPFPWHGPGDAVAAKLVLSILNGETAVGLFFVISGVVLFRSLQSMAADPAPRVIAAFAVRRFLRIWPVMAACLLVSEAALAGAAAWTPLPVAPPDAAALARNLLLAEYGVNGATWTLHVELAMVVPLLAFFLAWRRVGVAALLGLAGYSLAAFVVRGLVGWDTLLMAGLPFFVAGLAVASGRLDGLLRRRGAGWAAALAVAGLAAVALFTRHGSALRLLLQTGLATTVVGWAYAAPPGRAMRWLEGPTSRFLGRISYSFYLWNVVVFELMLAAVQPAAQARPVAVGLAVGVAAMGVTIPIAALSERWLEQPCIALGRALTRRRRRDVRAPVSPGGPARRAAVGSADPA